MSGVLRFTDTFHLPGTQSPVAWEGRVRFLEAVRALRPQALDELHVVHRENIQDTRVLALVVNAWLDAWGLWPLDPVRDNWPREIALATLDHWAKYPEIVASRGLRWKIPTVVTPRGPFSWNEEAEWRWAHQLKRSSAELERLAVERGFTRTPILREPAQFARLVLYQVLGWSYARIVHPSRKDKAWLYSVLGQHLRAPDKRTLQSGIHHTAELIGLRLRPPGKPPGRPRRYPKSP